MLGALPVPALEESPLAEEGEEEETVSEAVEEEAPAPVLSDAEPGGVPLSVAGLDAEEAPVLAADADAVLPPGSVATGTRPAAELLPAADAPEAGLPGTDRAALPPSGDVVNLGTAPPPGAVATIPRTPDAPLPAEPAAAARRRHGGALPA